MVPPVPRLEVRLPQDDDELWEYVATIWGVQIPRTRVCPHHSTPFEAFADAYFARSVVAVWKASRGFGGKSYLLATLALTELVNLASDVTVLGGSGQQSERVITAMAALWNAPFAPRHLMASEPGKQEMRTTQGAVATALMASQRSVRGAHPPRLRGDEVDEMDLAILDAALGQPMSSATVRAHTVLSSTHQYPDGTMTEVLRRAAERGHAIFEWCFKETLEPHGWLSQAEVERKRLELPATMWQVEIELQEPAAEGRAIVTDAVEWMFAADHGQYAGLDGEYIETEAPSTHHEYATGADWAKQTDWTVIVTLRVDCKPARVVAFERIQRLPWPVMVARLDARLKRFPGSACHDGTGLGNVVDDLLTQPAMPVQMVGRDRAELFSEYIAGIERHEITSPRIDWMHKEHRYCRRDDLFKTGGHPPDSFVAGAMAYRAWQQGLTGEIRFGNLAKEVRERIDWKAAP